MTETLATYLQDHLAGSRFALDLLKDLGEQDADPALAEFAGRLTVEISEDRSTLQQLAESMGLEPSHVKEMASSIAQKAGRLKLKMDEPIGRFEAMEMLALGVLGKLALWNALERIRSSDRRMDALNLDELISRAIRQHSELESRRLELASSALTDAAGQP